MLDDGALVLLDQVLVVGAQVHQLALLLGLLLNKYLPALNRPLPLAVDLLLIHLLYLNHLLNLLREAVGRQLGLLGHHLVLQQLVLDVLEVQLDLVDQDVEFFLLLQS